MFKEIKTVLTVSQKSPRRYLGKDGGVLSQMVLTSDLQEIKSVFKGLETLYQTYLPKVNPTLIHGLLVREQEKAERAPFYMVEVFTKRGTDSQWCKEHIWNTCGSVPAIYDNGTHYATNMRLTSDILKKLNDLDFVIDVSGDYTGSPTGTGASHERRGQTYE